MNSGQTTTICCDVENLKPQTETISAFNPKTKVKMGSARASRAVFRALAENIARTKRPKGSGERGARKGWTRGASSNTRGRVCSPTPAFGFNFPLFSFPGL